MQDEEVILLAWTAYHCLITLDHLFHYSNEYIIWSLCFFFQEGRCKTKQEACQWRWWIAIGCCWRPMINMNAVQLGIKMVSLTPNYWEKSNISCALRRGREINKLQNPHFLTKKMLLFQTCTFMHLLGYSEHRCLASLVWLCKKIVTRHFCITVKFHLGQYVTG